MNDQTDSQLLRAYVEHRSEPAFTELVRRHVDIVHSAALRMVCDSHLAQDVTQGVFVALARNTAQLKDRPVLSGWLHRTAQNIAAQTVRTDVRRRAHEQEAAAMNELLSAEPDVVWEHIAPHLDSALGKLSEADRDALMLRYFERKSADEMAATLGISDEAAQKRVRRAVERLREFFARRGITVGASGLVVIISANAVQAAPVGLAVTISTAALLAGTTISTTATATAIKTIAMTTTQKTFIATTLAVAFGMGIHQVHQASRLRDEVRTLGGQHAEQVQELIRERDEATGKLAGLREENERLIRNNAELQKLRAEAMRLRGELNRAEQATKNKPNSEIAQSAIEIARTNALPVENYSATARAVVPWNQGIITGGWKTPSGKIIYVLAVTKHGDDATVVMIETHLIEVSVEAATRLGLDQSNTGGKETNLATVLTTELCDSIVKTSKDTNAVSILSSPRVTTLTGRQASIQSMDDKETPTGEKYSVGPTLTYLPTISADGQSVNLDMIANVAYLSPAADQ